MDRISAQCRIVCLSGSRNQIEIEVDPRHREILLAQTNLDGANVRSVTTPAVKAQDWLSQMLTKLDRDIQKCDANEETWSMLKRLVRYFVDHSRLVQVISEQRFVKAPHVDTDSDHAGCVLTRKSTTCAHLFHGVNLINDGSLTQVTRSLSIAASEFYAGVKGGSILLAPNA